MEHPLSTPLDKRTATDVYFIHDYSRRRLRRTERSVKRSKPIGSLSHADFGKTVHIPGYGTGVLWGIQHVAAFGDIPEPWTRLTFERGGGSEGTRGLPPTTVIDFPAEATR